MNDALLEPRRTQDGKCSPGIMVKRQACHLVRFFPPYFLLLLSTNPPLLAGCFAVSPSHLCQSAKTRALLHLLNNIEPERNGSNPILEQNLLTHCFPDSKIFIPSNFILFYIFLYWILSLEVSRYPPPTTLTLLLDRNRVLLQVETGHRFSYHLLRQIRSWHASAHNPPFPNKGQSKPLGIAREGSNTLPCKAQRFWNICSFLLAMRSWWS